MELTKAQYEEFEKIFMPKTKKKGMPNAQKWSIERVWTNLMDIERLALGHEVLFLGRALVMQGHYADIWRYWKKIYGHDDGIREAMMRIESIFEAKLYEGALLKKLSPWVAIFVLKNNYHWDDTKPEEPEEEVHLPMIVELAGGTVEVIP